MGVLRRNKVIYKGVRNSFFIQLKLMFICFLFLSISLNNITIIGEGFFIFDEVNSSLLKEGESGTVLCVQDDFLYLNVWNFSQVEMRYYNFVKIFDVHQSDNTNIVGSIEFKHTYGVVQINVSYNIDEISFDFR